MFMFMPNYMMKDLIMDDFRAGPDRTNTKHVQQKRNEHSSCKAKKKQILFFLSIWFTSMRLFIFFHHEFNETTYLLLPIFITNFDCAYNSRIHYWILNIVIMIDTWTIENEHLSVWLCVCGLDIELIPLEEKKRFIVNK